VQIASVTGKDNFKNFLRDLSIGSNFHNVEKIAFVGDADDDAEYTFKSIKGSFKSAIKELGNSCFDVHNNMIDIFSEDISLSNNVIIRNGTTLGIYNARQ
jgi:hypothetical protein